MKKLSKKQIIGLSVGIATAVILLIIGIATCNSAPPTEQGAEPGSAASAFASPSASPESSADDQNASSAAASPSAKPMGAPDEESSKNESSKTESSSTESSKSENSASESHAPSNSSGSAATAKPTATTKPTSSNSSSATAKPTSTPKPGSGGTTVNNPTATPKPAATATPKPAAATSTPKPSATATPKPTATPEPKKVWVVDVPAQEEQGHWEEEYYVTSDWVYQCNDCGATFPTTAEVNAHIDNNSAFLGNGDHVIEGYTMVSGPTYEVYTGNKYWIVDVPAQEEQGHWEYE